MNLARLQDGECDDNEKNIVKMTEQKSSVIVCSFHYVEDIERVKAQNGEYQRAGLSN